MVEHLRRAVAKARAEGRAQAAIPFATPGVSGARDADALWPLLPRCEIGADALRDGRLVAVAEASGTHSANPARAAFDMLRTRIMRLLEDNGWSRVAVASPRAGAGTTFTALNLALSLARNPEIRVMLIDLNLRASGLAAALGVEDAKRIEPFLKGDAGAEDHFARIGDNLMVGLNSASAPGGADLIQSRRARRALDDAVARYAPTVVICDLSPLASGDEALFALSLVDGVLLVAEAGETRAREIAECEALILEHAHLIGVSLNKAERTA